MTPATLRTYTAKQLGQMARQKGVSGWHAMRKDELIAALAAAKSRKSATANSQPAAAKPAPAKPTPGSQAPVVRRKRPTAAQRRLADLQQRKQRLQDLSTLTPACQTDQLLLLVRDPYWLQVTWEISSASISRAKTSLGQHWHGASPVIRLSRLAEDGAVLATRQINIHGGVGHWYIDVTDPPGRYRAEIGYADLAGGFYCLVRSNEVMTPEPGVSDAADQTWNDVARNADRVYALSGGYSEGGPSQELRQALENRLRRPLGRPTDTRELNAPSITIDSTLSVEIDAQVLMHGETAPHTHLTILGEPVAVAPDGSFAVKLPFPDRRQVIPVVASSADGLHQKTIIVGVERNTKALEPRRRDAAAS